MSEIPSAQRLPSVTAVIATQDRVELLQRAVTAIWNQSYAGSITINIVYDNHLAHPELARRAENREVRVLSNDRTPGLAGARNTGILATQTDLVAFCDDDDAWKPDKLSKQVELLSSQSAQACVSGIEIEYGDKRIVRIPQVASLNSETITRDRLTGAHPSSYLFDRHFLAEQIGLVDESIPYGYGEDYDLLIRAAKHGRVALLPEPAVNVLWHKGGSYFSRRWEAMEAGISFLIVKHPELTATKPTAAWLHGQRAFALASLKNRRSEAVKVATQSIRLNPRQPRGYLALAVCTGALSPQWVVNRLNEKGRGI
ncbi:glycosyltransferase family 2 protein [Paeniglutamicibacter gangotriensis]|uniref:Glycosyltransferase n=1 Tax=Paeniglutamicibacter gangotriensis Lz1y TaxID=1276920 RepID=M7MWD7_9MICC|nr:glycosyltransferase [Paeniglutamicibacter gangotriensis]EMQ99381.1 glycosyltransferase [Paeniglutamicibacter gangotriensis Lz1y]